MSRSQRGRVPWYFSYWATALGAAAYPLGYWAWPAWGTAETHPEPVAAATDLDMNHALDLEVIRSIYRVLVTETACTTCGASLEGAIATPSGMWTAEVLVTTRCRGWKHHHHAATVTEQDGDLRFGELSRT